MAEQRRLVTIMAVDVAGYSAAAEIDDGAAAAAVAGVRDAINEAIAPNGGRVFNTAGDGFMIEFPAAASGIASANALLTLVRARSLPRLRIGLHLGDVIVADNGDLLGHGVNVAARLMQMAEPNTAVLSGAVKTQLRQTADIPLKSLGRVQLDKMSERVEVFAIADDGTRFARSRSSTFSGRRCGAHINSGRSCIAEGLVQYWRESGHWPDFCAREGVCAPYGAH